MPRTRRSLQVVAKAARRSTIEAGMRVVGSDGQRIGTVTCIWRSDRFGANGGSAGLPPHTDPDAYLMVARRPLFDPLYIPVSQVHSIAPGHVVLPVPAEVIEQQGWVGRRTPLPDR